MFEAVLQGLLITVLVILSLGLAFVIWAVWLARAAFKKLWQEIVTTAKKAHNNSYTKEELYAKIRFWEIRNKSKAAIYWRRRLYEIYPEENPHGEHHA